MNVYRLIRAFFFFYELLRLLILAVLFVVFSPLEGAAKGEFFPYLVYVSPNALFPLMTLFMWLRPGEYRNYLHLYMAGKLIAVAAFCGWGFFAPKSPGLENLMELLILVGGSFLLSLCDIFSVFGSWALSGKTGKTEGSAGLLTGDNGGL
jgi:hypothetical protein